MNKLKQIVVRKYELLLNDLFIRGLSDPSFLRSLPLPKNFFIPAGCRFDHWYFGGEVWEYGRLLLEQEEKRPGFILSVFNRFYDYGEQVRKKSEEIKRIDFSKLPMEKLIAIFKEFADLYSPFAFALTPWGIEKPLEARLRELLQNRKNPDEVLAVLTFPRKVNVATIEQEKLLKIGEKLQVAEIEVENFEKLSSKFKKMLEKHAVEFGWINSRGGLNEPWNARDMYNRLNVELTASCFAKLTESNRRRKEQEKKFNKLVKELALSDKELHFVELAKELVYYRTYRTDYLNMAFANIHLLLVEISKRMGYSFHELLQFRVDELINQQKLSRVELGNRMKNFIFLSLEPNKVIFSADPKVIAEVSTKYLEAEIISVSEVKGSIAFQGKASGRVVLVIAKSDLDKVREGDVIVTRMTTPDMIVAMQKAVAFVTDEGGITCHAAIVSRELKKPCIIGTKVATKAFKDGDLVEVDAVNGIVKKLS